MGADNGIAPDHGPRFAILEAELDRVAKIAIRTERDVANEKAWRLGLDAILTKLADGVRECLNQIDRVNNRLEMLQGALVKPPPQIVKRKGRKFTNRRK